MLCSCVVQDCGDNAERGRDLPVDSSAKGSGDSEFDFTLAQAKREVSVAMANERERYGYEGIVERDCFELGGEIKEYCIASDGLKCMTDPEGGRLFPVYCNGRPIAVFWMPSEEVRQSDAAGNYPYLSPMPEAAKDCIVVSDSIAQVFLWESPAIMAGTPLDVDEDKTEFWVVNEDWYWCYDRSSNLASESSELKPGDSFYWNGLPADIADQIQFSDGELRIPFEVTSDVSQYIERSF